MMPIAFPRPGARSCSSGCSRLTVRWRRSRPRARPAMRWRACAAMASRSDPLFADGVETALHLLESLAGACEGRSQHRRSGNEAGFHIGARCGWFLTDLHHHANVQGAAAEARPRADIRRDEPGTGIGRASENSGSIRPRSADPGCPAVRGQAASPASGRDSRSRSA